LDATSTSFEEPRKKSARNIGIRHPEPGETASGAIHDTRYVYIHGKTVHLMSASFRCKEAECDFLELVAASAKHNMAVG
jgi:hypothetical protein